MFFRVLGLILLFLTAGCVNLDNITATKAFTEETIQGSGSDKIAVIHINGIISNFPKKNFLGSRPSMLQEVIAQLRMAAHDSKVKAILLVVDSPGGSVTASDILYNEIKKISTTTKKPVHALMMGVAASGGYYVCLAAKTITAHPTTITGSIGVIATYFSIEELLHSIGVNVTNIVSGSMKDAGSPFKQLKPNEQTVFQEIVATFNNRFQNLVKENRKNLNPQKAPYTDARILTAQQALNGGLIDSIGYFDDTITKIQSQLKLQKVRVVTYKRNTIPNATEYHALTSTVEPSATGAMNLLQSVPQFSQGFYYLWQQNS